MKLKVCGMKLNTAEVATLQPDYLGFIFWEPSSRYFEGKIPELPKGVNKVGVFVDASLEEILVKIGKYDLQAVQLHGNESPEFCYELRIRTRNLKSRSNTSSRQQARVNDKSDLLNRQKGATVDNSGIVPKHEGVTRDDSDLLPSPKGLTDIKSDAVEIPPAKIDLKIIKVFSIKDTFDFSILRPYEEVCDYYLFDTKGKLPGGNGYVFDWGALEDYPSTKPYFLSGGIGLGNTEALKAFTQRPEATYCHAIDVNSQFETKPGLKDVEMLKEFTVWL